MNKDNRCGAYIKHISDVLQRNCNNALQSYGLTLSQLTVLHRLKNAGGGKMTLKELEKTLQVAQSTAAGIISRMEQKGLVESYTDPADKRIKLVRISREGHRCFDRSEIHSVKSEKNLLSALTSEEKELFISLLRKVSNSI